MAIKSLKNYFEQIEKEKLTEADLALPIIGKDGKAVSMQPGFIKMQGDTSPAGKAMSAAIKDMVAKKQIQVVAPFDKPQQQPAQQQAAAQQKPATGTAMKEEMIDEKAPPGMEKWIKDRKPAFKEKYGKRWEEVLYATAWKEHNKAKNEGAEDNPPPPADSGEMLDEKWAGDAKVKPTGQYKDKTKEELKSMLAKLHKSGPHGKDSPAAKKMRQINFALRAKGGWKSGEGAAMKEAEIPSSGPDYGAGLGAGRSDKVLEAKPDFLDLDKDGNKKESMKKAAADKKKKVKESMNTLEAAYHEGKSHGLSKHGYACRYNEGSDEHKRYHDGYKEGLDECYGLQPNRGLVVSEVDAVPATVPGMADQAAGMDEGNAFTAALAKADKGEKFSVGGKTFTDRSNYDAKIDEFAFESLDKQLNSLLESEETVQEGLSVNMSKGMGGMGEDTVSVSANGDDAGKLIDFIKQVGLGGLGGAQATVGAAEPVVAVASDYGAPAFSGHDGMKDLMNKVTGGEDYKDEEGHEHGHDEEKCNECGMMEAECGCEKKEAVMGEEETPDQMTDEMAEGYDDDGYEGDEADAAKIDASMPAKGGATNEDTGSEAQNGPAQGVEAADDAEEAEEEMNESKFMSLFKKLSVLAEESTEEKDEKAEKAGKKVVKDIEYDDKKDEEKLDEWANDAGKKGTDQAFERDIEFMTKVIAGGLNKPKATGQTTIPVIASQDARNGDEDVSAWKKLAGLDK